MVAASRAARTAGPFGMLLNGAASVGRAIGRAGSRMFSIGLGYDAVRSEGRRKPPDGINRSEDQELSPFERARLLSGSRDIARNFSIAGWMIRKHLDYVSTFSFREKKLPSGAQKGKLEKLIKEWSKAENCDASGRHGLQRMIRLAERSRTVDGDLLIMRLANGKLQAIEGDRVRTPPGGIPAPYKAVNFSHGVQTEEGGRPLRYCVCRRGKASDFSTSAGVFYFERMIEATNVWHHGYYDRFDQIRGISPMTSAINALRDVYEGQDYALAKMKVSQLFALAIYRSMDDSLGTVSTGAPQSIPQGTVNYVPDPETAKPVIDFGKGPQVLDLDKEDKAEFLESKTPSTELQSFMQVVIAACLKALDIPYSFYAENFTNFSGQRQAWIQYDLACQNKRQDNIDLLDAITRWRILLWIEDGELEGAVEDYEWEWMPTGVPWIDPLKEVTADTQAVAAGFTSRTRVCREKGEDFYEIIDEIEAENKAMTAKGLETRIQVQNVQISEVAPQNAA